MSGLLPPGYAALERFVAEWDIADMAGRARRRDDSTAAERQAFYEAARGLVTGALAELDSKPLDRLDTRERRLANLMLSYAHVALAVEIRGSGEDAHREDRRHMAITREPGGLPTG